jgi:hypothetical protein
MGSWIPHKTRVGGPWSRRYPMNWWLVANHLKHGMFTVPRADTGEPVRAHAQARTGLKGVATHVSQAGAAAAGMDEVRSAPVPPVMITALVSFVALAGGAVIAWLKLMGHG